MTIVELAYLGLVVAVFCGFGGVLGYVSHMQVATELRLARPPRDRALASAAVAAH